MTDDELERRLRDALDAYAHAAGGQGAPPPPRFATAHATARTRGSRLRWAAPIAAAAAVIGIVSGVLAVGSSTDSNKPQQAAGTRTGSLAALPPTAQAGKAVHVRLLNDDGMRYGVGMPVIAYFSQWITDARPLQQATKATVNGKPVQGAWYFEHSDAGKGPIEAHFRLPGYWPADSDVRISLPIKGLSAGGGLTYDDSLTTEFHTGPKTVATVNDKTHQLTVTRDGKQLGRFDVAIGPSTRRGKKVIMEKPGDVTMSINRKKTEVHYAQRLTYGGEYLVAAPWNVKDIEAGIDSSNGCTNLLPRDAAKLFSVLEIGDVVVFEAAPGTPMALGSGYGDWNLTWREWLKGGLVKTH